MRNLRAAKLRVIVKMVSPPPKSYAYVIIDNDDGRELFQPPDRFRTSSLAWEAGVAALARMHGPGHSRSAYAAR
jgi:hypothetical protein